MKTRRVVLIACLVPLSIWVSPGPAQASVLSLKEAVQFALENSPVFDSARKTQAIRELEYKNAVAKLLPSLDFSTTDGLQNDIPIASGASESAIVATNPTAPWYSALNLGLTESLYDNGISLTGISVADLSRDLALVQLEKARDSLALDVATEFYGFSLATILLEVRKQQQAVLDKQFRTLSSEYQQGFKTRSDFLRFKTQVQRAEIDRVTAENGVVQSEAGLRKTLGVSLQAPEQPSFDPVRVDQDHADVFFSDRPPPIENAYDYRASKIQKEIDAKSVTLAERSYWPQLSVNSGITYANENYLGSGVAFSAGHQLSWNALLTLQYNLWDWGSRKRAVAIAEYNRAIKEDTLNQGLFDVNAQMVGLMGDIKRLSKNYRLTRELLGLEEESNRDLEIQYREGKVTYLDLVTELNNLLDAKVQFCTSYFDALTSAAKYRYYEGKLYESLMEK